MYFITVIFDTYFLGSFVFYLEIAYKGFELLVVVEIPMQHLEVLQYQHFHGLHQSSTQ